MLKSQPFFYQAFGLIWAIPFVCPELCSVDCDRVPDISVQIASVPATSTNRILHFSTGQVVVSLPKIGRFSLNQGKQIVIDPVAGITDELRLYLLGSIAALLLMQRGLFLLHASGIATSQGAILFAGHSGAGKSTLAAAFVQHGYDFLADDVVAIKHDREQATVLPSYPSMRLWKRSLHMLDTTAQHLRGGSETQPNKHRISVHHNYIAQPLPVLAIYLLQPVCDDAFWLEPLTDVRKFQLFTNHSWHHHTLHSQQLHLKHFQQAVSILNQTRVVRVYRSNNPNQLEQLVATIEADFHQQ